MFGDLRATKDPCNLFYRSVFIQQTNLCSCHLMIRLFGDLKMFIRHRCDLRQMRDTDHLMISSDHCHLLRYFLCRSSADTGVDLVKDQRLCLIFIRKDRFDRQHDTGKLTAGYHFCQRS